MVNGLLSERWCDMRAKLFKVYKLYLEVHTLSNL
jgi:hypothetical protein